MMTHFTHAGVDWWYFEDCSVAVESNRVLSSYTGILPLPTRAYAANEPLGIGTCPKIHNYATCWARLLAQLRNGTKEHVVATSACKSKPGQTSRLVN